jgi:ketosteroid isomerase-like protein
MDLEERTRNFFAALDTFRPEDALAHVGEGAVIELGNRVLDREGYGRAIEAKQRHLAAGRHHVLGVAVTGSKSMAEWEFRAALSSGEPLRTRGVHVLEWDGDRLTRIVVHGDTAAISRIVAGAPAGAPPPDRVRLVEAPHHFQRTDYTCGPATFKMLLEAVWGLEVDEASLARRMRTNERIGTRQRTMTRFVQSLGLEAHEQHTDTTLDDVRQLMHDGHIVLVCYWLPDEDTDHYALVLEAGADHVILHDPWYGADQRLARSDFEARWHGDRRVGTRRDRWLLAVRVPQLNVEPFLSPDP